MALGEREDAPGQQDKTGLEASTIISIFSSALKEAVLKFIYNKAKILRTLGIFYVRLFPVNGPQLFELYCVLHLQIGLGNPKE